MIQLNLAKQTQDKKLLKTLQMLTKRSIANECYETELNQATFKKLVKALKTPEMKPNYEIFYSFLFERLRLHQTLSCFLQNI